jgi:hypothetical protein
LRKYIPGFEKSQETRNADMPLNRVERFIENSFETTKEQVKESATCDDAIAVRQSDGDEGPAHEIPYRAMVPEKLSNLLAVGKSSAGGAAFRTHMLSVIMGQAAGTAAALAAKEQVSVRDIPIRKLQAQLRAAGIDLPPKPDQPQTGR